MVEKIFIGTVVVVLAAFIIWVANFFHKKSSEERNLKLINSWLKTNTTEKKKWFSTREIASGTGLDMGRVRFLCEIDIRIYPRDIKNNDFWGVNPRKGVGIRAC